MSALVSRFSGSSKHDHSHAGDAGKERIMAHHKRKRPKNRRAGCLMCKPHKGNNAKNKEKPSVKRRLQPEE